MGVERPTAPSLTCWQKQDGGVAHARWRSAAPAEVAAHTPAEEWLVIFERHVVADVGG